ncbi:hypothetical protein M413DRAFT_30276 [Hebeloma cylindrosporum]|uniref:F-box domain-containing protein n=1 Tax=Hebeloma cylindrosporum TaxID=76867 RepID=A0A0C2YAV5_HEBCY|nr:hypothetical protein M413DRAFT_30276 [Hebeloma cylindrosporum h7]
MNGGPCLLCQEDVELERKIQELQDKRRNLQTRMNASHDPFILKFPPEISSHILLLSLQEWDYDPFYECSQSHDGIRNELPTPFLLSTICRGWRQLARSTPSLWTTVSFTLEKPTKVPLLEAIRDWLLLSGGLPLKIWISSYEGKNPVSQEMYGPVINALNQHSGRWQKLSLCIPASYFRHFRGSSPTSSLYDLQIINSGDLDTDGLLPAFRMNFKPSPTNLSMCSIRLSANDIGCGNLTSLSMQYMSVNDCIVAIRHAPLLESCEMRQIDSRGDVSTPNTNFRHTRLRDLDLGYVREDLFIDQLLRLMECPALEEFSSRQRLSIAMVDSLVSFFKRSESRLKELGLYGDGDTEEKLAVEFIKKLLNAVPYLHGLFLGGNTLPIDDLLEELSSSPPILAGGTPGFLPRLQSLALYSYDISKWEYIPYIYTWPHRKHLRMTISPYDRSFIVIDDDTQDKISQLIDQGANIHVLKRGKDYFRSA